MKHILILGAGFGGLETYLSLRRRWKNQKKFRITIINQHNYFLYTPMLHEVAFGTVQPSHILHPIREFTRREKNIDQFFEDEVMQIVPEENKVLTKQGREFTYDILVIACGGRQTYSNIPGAERYALPMKTMRDGIYLRNRIIETFEQYKQGELFFTIIGGGATGVETAGQMAELFQKTMRPLYGHIDFSKVHITLLHDGSRLLSYLKGETSMRILKKLSQMGVQVLLEKKAVKLSEQEIFFENNERLPSHLTVWTTGIASPAPFFLLPRYLNHRGFIGIEKTLLVKGTCNVFALGDIAECEKKNIPKTAQTAMAQGKHLAKNIHRLLRGKKLLSFKYHHKGDIIPLGNWFAVAQINGRVFSGRFVWWLRRTIFLFNLYQTSDKFRVIADWTINIFSRRDTSKMD